MSSPGVAGPASNYVSGSVYTQLIASAVSFSGMDTNKIAVDWSGFANEPVTGSVAIINSTNLALIFTREPPTSHRLVYWDATNTATGLQNGSGTWSLGDRNWLTDGSEPDRVWLNGRLDQAVFGASAGVGSWTVTVSSAVITNSGVTFLTTGSVYTVAGTGVLCMVGSGSAITAAANASLMVPVGGSVGLVKQGAGTLSLYGNNSYSGGTVISNGVLRLSKTALAPSVSGLSLWVDASDQSSVVTDGVGAVSQWVDKSGNGLTLIAPTNSSNKPTYVANALNGLPVVRFDGNDVIANAFNFGNAFTILSVTRLEGSQNGRLVTGFNNWLLGYHGNLRDRMYAEGWVDTGTTYDTNLHFYAAFGDGTYVAFYDGLTLLANNNGGVKGPNGISLGAWANNPASEATKGDVAELLIFSRALTVGEYQQVMNYLTAKWGSAGGGVGYLPVATSVQITSGATLDLNGANQTVASLAGAAGSFVSLSAGSLTFGDGNSTAFAGVGSGVGGLRKQGSGTVTFSGANTYTGLTSVAAGVLKLGAVNALPGVAGSGNVNVDSLLDVNGFSQVIGAVSGTGIVDNVAGGAGAYTLTLGANNGNGSFAGVIKNAQGTISLTKSGTGTQTLGNTNIYGGATVVNNGTLKLAGLQHEALIYYDFDSISGNRVVNKGTGGAALDGVVQNAAVVAGKVGNAYSLSGASSGAVTLNATNIGNAFTFAAWVLATNANPGVSQRIIMNDYANSGYLGTDNLGTNRYMLITRNNFDYSITEETNGVWHHVAMVWDGANTSFYYDGVLQAGFPVSRLLNTTYTQKFGFGCNLNYGENWRGLMDEACVFTRALAPSEIMSLYAYYGTTNVLPAGTDLAINNGGVLENIGLNTVKTLTGASGSGLVLDDGILSVGDASSTTFAGNMSGIGTISKQGAGQLTLSGLNSQSNLTVMAGTLLLSGAGTPAGANGIVTVNGAGTVLNLGGTTAGIGAFVLGGGTVQNGTITAGAAFVMSNGTASANLTGAAMLTKSGAGTVTLSGVNAWSGDTTVSAGTLKVGSATAIPGGAGKGNMIVNGTLDLNGNSLLVNGLYGAGVLDNVTGGAGSFILTVGPTNGVSLFSGLITNTQGTVSLIKTNAGTLVLYGATNYNNFAYSGQTLISGGAVYLDSAVLSGSVSISTGAVLSLPYGWGGLQRQNGLRGEYYNAAPNAANFATLDALNTHLAGLTPALVSMSTNAGANFDFAANGSGFPPPYNVNAVNMEARWTGKFYAATSGDYTFYTASDDGSMLWIDGGLVVNNNYSQGVTERSGTTNLAAGPHDIVIAYYEGGGLFGMYCNVTVPGGSKQLLSNSLLTYGDGPSAIGSLSGEAGSLVVITNDQLTINQSADQIFAGTITGSGVSLIKAGAGTLTLNCSNTFSGTIVVTNGSLSLTASNGLGQVTSISVETNGQLRISTNADAICDGAVVYLKSSGTTYGKIYLTNSVDETVGGLYFDGVGQLPGTYGHSGIGATYFDDNRFAGTGVLRVGADGSWGVNNSGNWTTTANWLNNMMASGIGRTAYFTNAIGADRTVTVDSSPWIIGSMVFGSPGSYNWIVTGGTLNLSVVTGMPVVAVSTNTSTVNSVITGARGVSKTGTGALVLGGNNTFSGGYVNIAGNTYVNSAGALGSNTVTLLGGQLWINDGTIYSLTNIVSGTGNLVINNSGTLTNTAVAPININGTLYVGYNANGKMAVQPGGSVTATSLRIGDTANSPALTISGGVVTATGGNGALYMGANASATATLNMNGGSLIISGGGYAVIGDYGAVVWNQSGGLVNDVSGGNENWFANNGGAVSMTVTGGVFSQTGGGGFRLGVRGPTTLTVGGSGFVSAGYIIYGHPSTGGGTDVVNLNTGGTIQVSYIAKNSGTATFNFNGGTLLAPVSSSTYMQGLNNALVLDGGAVIDIGTNAITIAQNISSGGAGIGSLLKLGPGVLTLSGTNTYTGVTLVSNGVLRIAGAGMISNSASINVYSNTTLSISGVVAGVSVAGLTVSAGATNEFWIATNGVSPVGVTGTVNLAGALYVQGGGNVSTLATNYPLINAGANPIVGLWTNYDAGWMIGGYTFIPHTFIGGGSNSIALVPMVYSPLGATNLTANAADLLGYLCCTSALPTFVTVYWGLADGGTDPSAWENSIYLGQRSGGALTTTVSVTSDKLYYYRYFATNSATGGWSPWPQLFVPGFVTLSGISTNAAESGPVPATFSVMRPVTASTGPLAVSYTISGTASNGVDYQALSGSVVIPAGQTNAIITVMPIDDMIAEGDETVTLTLSPGEYRVGTPGTAMAVIADNEDLTTRWPYKVKISFTNYSKAETLTNFPALVMLGANISGFSYGQFMSTNGSDLRFADSNETRMLNYEVEKWDTNRLVNLPTDIAGCGLWLDGSDVDGDGVSEGAGESYVSGGTATWVDKSGNGNNFTNSAGSQPAIATGLINGRDGLTFNGSSTYMTRLGGVLAAGKGNYEYITVWRPRVASGTHRVFEQYSSGNNNLAALLVAGAAYGFNGENNDRFDLVPFVANDWIISDMKVDNSLNPGNVNIYHNGMNFAGTTPSPGTLNVGATSCNIGRKWSAGEYFDGDLMEVIVYTNALTALQRRQIGAYLSCKYNINTAYDYGKSYIWVQVPQLTSNTYIWAYWGRSGLTAPDYTTNGAAWADGFAGVWHMNQTNALDSTAGRNNVQSYGVTNAVCNVATGAAFSGSSAYLDVADGFANFTNGLTLSVWSYPTSSPTWARFFDFGNGAPMDNFLLARNGASADLTYEVYVGVTSGGKVTATGVIANNQWQLFSARENASGSVVLYKNGLQVAAGTSSVPSNTVRVSNLIGRSNWGADLYYAGYMDEVRVENVSRSSNWMWACWLNVASNSVFNGFGTAQFSGAGPDILLSGASNVAATTAGLVADLTSTGTSVTAVSVYWDTAYQGTNTSMYTFSFAMPGDQVVGYLTNTVSSLAPNTTYYFRCLATNFAGAAWSSAGSFKTPGPPVINNADGAANIAQGNATLRGRLTSGGTGNVYICWGPFDGGTSLVTWANIITNNGVAEGAFSGLATALAYGVTYQYRCYASNDYGEAWAPSLSTFGLARYKMQIAFTNYTQAEVLTNFPALVVLGTNLAGFAYNQFTAAGGGDLRFMNSNETVELNYEIDQWNAVGSSFAWVQVPALDSNATIWAYWGGAGMTAPVYTTNGTTWASGFKGVWHLNGIADSSTNLIAGLNSGSVAASGVVGNGRSFDGNSYINCSHSALNVTNQLTIEAWLYRAGGSGWAFAFAAGGYGGWTYDYGITSNNKWGDEFAAPSGKLFEGPVVTNAQWHHVVFVFDGAGIERLYCDGVVVATNADVGPIRLSDTFRIGCKFSNDLKWNGLIDELRLSAVGRSSNWVWACYLNQASNGFFNACSSVVENAMSPSILSSGVVVNAGSVVVNGYLSSTGTAVTAVTLFWGPIDGGVNKSAWATTNSFGVCPVGPVTTNFTGLTPDLFYYRFYASNSAGEAWMPQTGTFSPQRSKMMLTFSGYNKPDTLTNFPALVILNENTSGFRYGQCSTNNGGDLRFMNSNETVELNYEIEQWNHSSASNSYIWVQVPSYYSNSYIWVTWGGRGLAAPAYTTNGATWSDGYRGVWHLNQSPAVDSTYRGHNGISNGVLTGAAGIVGRGINFQGGYFDCGGSADWNLHAGSFTLGAWVNTSPSGWISLMGTYDGNGWIYAVSGDTAAYWDTAWANGPAVSDNTWHYLLATRLAGGNIYWYLDGVYAGNFACPTRTTYAGLNLGQGGSGWRNTNPMSGVMDEPRIEGVNRSANWIWASYMTVVSNVTFNTFGSVVNPVYPSILNASASAGFTNAVLNGTLVSTGMTPTTVYVYWGSTDGGTNKGAWANSASLGVPGLGSVSSLISGLQSGNRRYYYRFLAGNTAGETWAPATGTFVTPAYRTQIFVGGYNKAETLTNFPLMLRLDSIPGFSYSQFSSASGSDLSFMNSNETALLNYEFDRWPTSASILPTNVSGLVLWLKSDTGVFTNSIGAVTNWVDQSGNGRAAVQTDTNRQPLCVAGVLNGYPVVRFDGVAEPYGDRLVPGDIACQTIIIVNRVASGCPGSAGIIGRMGADQSIRRGSTTAWSYPGNGNDFASPAGSLLYVNGVNTPNISETVWHVLAAERGTGTYNYDSIGGGIYADRNYKGDIAEVIVYNRALSAGELGNVSTYLARKYALATSYPLVTTQSVVWAQVPELVSNGCIWAYWGNGDQTNLSVCTTNGSVWSNGFNGVWHMTTPYATDSTTNRNTGVMVNHTHPVAGLIGDAEYLDGIDDYIYMPDINDSLDMTNAMTISAWVNLASVASYPMIVTKNPSGTAGTGYPGNYEWRLENGSGAQRIGFQTDYGTGNLFPAQSSSAIGAAAWYHLVINVVTGGTVNYYQNGVLCGSYAGSSLFGITNNNPLRIGARADGYYYPGLIDELEISGLTRSSNWIWACYMSQVAGASFATYSPVDSATLPGISDGNGPSGVGLTNAVLNGYLWSTGSAPTTVTVYWGPADGGVNKTLWAYTNSYGNSSTGAMSLALGGLTSGTPYYYRYCANNSMGEAWAASSTRFMTQKYKMKITFAGYSRTETLTNFPALVQLSVGQNGFDYGQFSTNNGGDLRFVNSNETADLNYEIEQWNSNGTSYAWVQVPQLVSNGFIWACWGASGVSAPPCTSNGATWDSSFLGVWHMMQTNALDSTANRASGTAYGVTTTAGPIAGAVAFNGSSWINTGIDALFDLTNNVTLSCWARRSAYAGDNWVGVIDKLGRWGNGYTLGFHPNGTCGLGAYFAGTFRRGAMDIVSADQWYYLAGTVSNGNVRGYRDAVLIGTDAGGNGNSIALNNVSLMFGKAADGGDGANDFFIGSADEIRMENVLRSGNWIWASYMNQASNSVFGVADYVQGTTGPLVTDSGASNVMPSSASVGGYLVATGGAPTSVWLYWGLSDAGTNKVLWDTAVSFGVRGIGAVGSSLSGLISGAKYYYRFYAVNSYGESWSPTAQAVTPTSHRTRLRFGGYTKNETLTNFPALVILGTNIDGFAYTDFASPSDGADLRFYNSNETVQLNYEIERWDSGANPGPTNVAGLVLWLKGDAGVETNMSGTVISWRDQSGLAHDMGNTYGTPTVSNGPNATAVVHFDGNSYMYTDYNFDVLTKYTMITVARYSGADTYGRVIASRDRNFLFGFYSSGDARFHAGNWIYNAGTANTNWHLHAGTINDAVDPQASFWKDCVLLTTNNTGSDNTAYRPGRLELGAYSGLTETSKCEVAEVVIYNRVLSDTEVNQVSWYLSQKYGLGFPAVDPGKSYVWVQVPELTSNAYIWAYWGTANGTNVPACTTNGATWSNGYAGVWHMNQLNSRDSTANGNHGTVNNNVDTAGLIAGAQRFSGNGNVSVPYSASLGLNTWTVSAWVKLAAEPGVFGILGTRIGGEYTFDYKVQGTSIHGDVGTGAGWITGAADIGAADTGSNGQGGDLPTNAWYRVAYVVDNAAAQIRMFVDGDLKKTLGYAGTPLLMKAGQTMWIGADAAAEYMNGWVDEVRVDSVARSSNWIWACWMNMASNNTFVTLQAGFDSDGDGVSDTREAFDGTDPNNSNSWYRITRMDPLNNWDVSIEFFMGANRTYNVLSSDGPTNARTLAFTIVSSAAGKTNWTDVEAMKNKQKKFYTVLEVLGPNIITNNPNSASTAQYVAYLQQRLGSKWIMSGLPVDFESAGANNLTNTLGEQLMRGFKQVGSSDTNGDQLYVMNGTNSTFIRHWVTNNEWWAIGPGGPEKTNTVIGPMTGFWLQRKDVASTNTIFAGKMRTNTTYTIGISNNWNFLQWPFTTDRAENAGFNTPNIGWGFRKCGGRGSIDPAAADTIMVVQGNSWKRYYLLDGTVDATVNGRWWDYNRGGYAGFTMQAGQGFYYFHRGSGFTWTNSYGP